MRLDGLYQEIILDHYKNPHRRGLREPYAAEVHHVNPVCGDEVVLRVALGEGDDPVVEDVSYTGEGCSISQASTSVMTDLVVGRPLREALAAYDAFLGMVQSRGGDAGDPDGALERRLEDAVAFAGVARYPARVKCALLGWAAFKDAAARSAGGATGTSTSSTGASRTDEQEVGA